ncbi:MAG: thermonuclease family protein [Tannerella sp.]|nr:thermonuclease family protein [Tannerella sp.]
MTCLSLTSQTEITGKVVRVADGDTFTLLSNNNEQIRVRLYGIDAPEAKQAFSEKSRLYLANLIAGKEVTIQVESIDKYSRTVAKVKTDSVEDVGLEMLKAGMA